jgi:type IV pilus assembly protein PilP
MQKHKNSLKAKRILSVAASVMMVMFFTVADARVSLKSFKSSSPSKAAVPVSPAPAKAASDKSTLSTAAGAAVGAAAGRAVGSAVAGTPQKPSSTPAVTPIKDIAAAKAALLAPETFTYNPVGKSDPFKPFIETDIKAASAQGLARAIPLSPLQRLEVEQFTLVGIAGNPNRRVAMVEDKMNKKFYPLIIGTTIGKYSGKVVDIQPDRVIVDERGTTTIEGTKTKPKRIIMRLSRDEVKP